jgi:hypothetical protein
MQLLAIPDYQGDNNSYSIAQIAQIQGVTLPSSLAYMVAIREITAGTTNTRLGGPAVSATNGLPLTTADSLILPNNSGTLPIPMRNSGLYDLNDIWLWVPPGDTLAILLLLPFVPVVP